MCGFAAVLFTNSAPVDRDLVARMTDVLTHRGPDDSGVFLSGSVALGFRRLAILDLSPSGHQPMTSDDGVAVLVFNGEIYNFLELREELIRLGHRFKSTGDTEVLLHAYLEWGADCLPKFNGMWAFVIYDKRRGTLFGSRDRFGIKPLYRFSRPDCVLLASEIKAIRASGLCQAEINWKRAARFLLNGQIDETPETFYTDIQQVRPGTAFEIDLQGRFREWPYWTLDEASWEVGMDPAKSFGELFEDAVRLHMRSDVPVGVHLSGGLDSTSIICSSARLRDASEAVDPLMAFSYLAPEFDESPYIADTIAQTGATLVALETTPDRLWQVLKEVLWFQDEPIYSMMPLVSYELMRLAKSHGVKVILNGQGADETLAGYPSYFNNYWCTLLGDLQVGRTWREIGSYAATHDASRTKLFLRQVATLTRSKLSRSRLYNRAARWRRARNLRNPWFTRELTNELSQLDPAKAPIALNDALSYSIYTTPLPRILRVEDRNAMAHSIESRLPFLDYRLVSMAFSLSPDWRMRGPWNKFVLRQAMRNRIPESVRTRPDKMGFPVPADAWIAGPLYEPIGDTLASRATRERGIYNVERILSDLARHRRGEIKLGSKIFDVAQFDLWAQQSCEELK